MVKTQCDARPVKAYIMSDLLKKFDHDTRNDVVQMAGAIAGLYLGMFCCMYFFFIFFFRLWQFFLCVVFLTGFFLLKFIVTLHKYYKRFF